MDSQNIIDLYNNLEDLDKEMNTWLGLSFDIRKRSDDACMLKYGCTNTELYNRTKAMLVKHTDLPEDPVEIGAVVSESFRSDDNRVNDLSDQVMYNKIQTSQLLQSQDSNVVIINDFMGEQPDYTMDDLYDTYNKFLNLPSNYQGYSNDYSMSLWGRAVPQMFTYMKNKIESYEDEENNLIIKTNRIKDDRLVQYKKEIIEAADNNDFLKYAVHKMDCLSKHTGVSIYESSVLESFAEQISYKEYDYRKDIPSVVPYLTYIEWVNIASDHDVLPFQYLIIDDPKKYYQVIHDLQLQLTSATDKSVIEDKILNIGWNPYIKITAESMKEARERQIKWFNENERCTIVDLSKYDTKITDEYFVGESLEENKLLEPVYIILTFTNTAFGKVITKFENCKYSHSGLALSAKLKKIFTFSIHPEKENKSNGISIESIDKYDDGTGNADIMVLCMFVTKSIKDQINKICNWYVEHKDKTKYGLTNIVNIVINKPVANTAYALQMVCSQFVDTVLKMCNIDVTGKNSNLVSPTDFTKPKEGVKLFTLFEGKKKEYNEAKVVEKIAALKRQKSYNDLIVTNSNNIMDAVKENLIEGFNISCSDNDEINGILKEIRSALYPDQAIVSIQELKLPFNFNSRGDLSIILPKDLQKEYQEAHRLLSLYDESNMDGIKHELARLYYLNYLIEKKLKRTKKADKSYKELIDLRARILNDFAVYFKIVKAKDKNFDFSSYMKTTEYYTKEMIVDSDTLKTSGAIIMKIIKNS